MPPTALSWDLAGIAVIVVGGTLLHFCFDRTGRRRVLAVFCPVNESVWEHLKMPYWPLLALTAVQLAVGDGPAGLTLARAVGFLVMCLLVLVLYVVTAAVAPGAGMRTRLAVDGTIFVVAVVIGQIACHLLLGPFAAAPAVVGVALLTVPIAVFALTTFTPPRARLFEDQITGGYGILEPPRA